MYTEPPIGQQTVNTTFSINALGDAVANIQDLDVLIPLEVVEFGVIITTAFSGVTTSPIITLASLDTGRVTVTNQATVTIPNGAAVGNVYRNRLSSPVTLTPGSIIRTKITTQGVGTAGNYRAYVLYRYKPTADAAMTNVILVTA